jgi:hypothetical protein
MTVLTIGTICFGLLVGYITYRTLVRTTDKASISDLAAVISAVGGGGITAIVRPGSTLFGWYAISLLVGFAAYAALYLKMNGRKEFAKVMGRDDAADQQEEPGPPRGSGAPHL